MELLDHWQAQYTGDMRVSCCLWYKTGNHMAAVGDHIVVKYPEPPAVPGRQDSLRLGQVRS